MNLVFFKKRVGPISILATVDQGQPARVNLIAEWPSGANQPGESGYRCLVGTGESRREIPIPPPIAQVMDQFKIPLAAVCHEIRAAVAAAETGRSV